MTTQTCTIATHPIGPHHHQEADSEVVAFGCDQWEDNACQCPPVFGPTFIQDEPVEAVPDFHPFDGEPPIPPVDLEPIRARLLQAWEGPWWVMDGSFIEAATVVPDPGTGEPMQDRVLIGRVDPGAAELIAHAPTDLTALLDEVERLRVVAARAAQLAEVERTVRLLHQPKRDPGWSLVQHTYCSCGAMETYVASDGYPAIGPAPYPCATVRALDGQ